MSGIGYLAPGGKHLTVEKGESGHRVVFYDGPPRHGVKPSADYLPHLGGPGFRSSIHWGGFDRDGTGRGQRPPRYCVRPGPLPMPRTKAPAWCSACPSRPGMRRGGGDASARTPRGFPPGTLDPSGPIRLSSALVRLNGGGGPALGYNASNLYGTRVMNPSEYIKNPSWPRPASNSPI